MNPCTGPDAPGPHFLISLLAAPTSLDAQPPAASLPKQGRSQPVLLCPSCHGLAIGPSTAFSPLPVSSVDRALVQPPRRGHQEHRGAPFAPSTRDGVRTHCGSRKSGGGRQPSASLPHTLPWPLCPALPPLAPTQALGSAQAQPPPGEESEAPMAPPGAPQMPGMKQPSGCKCQVRRRPRAQTPSPRLHVRRPREPPAGTCQTLKGEKTGLPRDTVHPEQPRLAKTQRHG